MPDPHGKKLCFVVGPIGDEGSEFRIHADWLLEEIIKPVLANFPDFDVKRTDNDARPGLIDVQMINDLLNAELVIADLSSLNPNAFYEIGIRHMAQKPIIHMQLATEKPPFDVSLCRVIRFARAQFSDLGKAKDELKRSVEAVLAPDYQPENPMTNARGHLNLEQNATPEMRVLMDEIQGVKSRLDAMETDLNTPMLPPGSHASWHDAVRDTILSRNRHTAAIASTALGSTSSTLLGIAPAVAKAVVIDSTQPGADTPGTPR
jgi:hypothetical protein